MESFNLFAESVLLEVLRVVASIMNMRGATEDVTFESHDNKRFKIRKGDMVFYYSQMLHLDSGVYKEPEVNSVAFFFSYTVFLVLYLSLIIA